MHAVPGAFLQTLRNSSDALKNCMRILLDLDRVRSYTFGGWEFEFLFILLGGVRPPPCSVESFLR